jgi:exocyst complex component 8
MQRRLRTPISGRSSVRLQQQPTYVQDTNFRQDVATALADASESEIQAFQSDLRKVKNRTSVDLQASVFQNRTQFIKISKEADKVKAEMRTLRSLMSELTTTLGQTAPASGPTLDSVAQRRANRSSVANLEALWNTHLQTLWKRVEGSQKYLPAVPGRHIVYESGRWVELNAATWKPRRRVHLILLNDHLLVATEKKRTDANASPNARDAKDKQGPAQLVAVRCWPLQDVQMADLSMRTTAGGSAENRLGSSNAVSVRVGTDSFTFATGSSEASEKATLLTNFRKTAEDLRKALEAESQERAGHKSSNVVQQELANGYLASAARSPDLLDSFSSLESPAARDILIDVDGKPQNLRWVESQIDDLDIDIALQRFEEAVSRVEKLRRIAKNIKSNPLAQQIVVLKLNDRASKLATVLVRYLQDSHNWLTATKSYVDWLMRLGFDDLARTSYLEARSGVIKKRIRQVIFDGDLASYIYQISLITFTIIKDTAVIFANCFPPVMMSAVVKWAKTHVDEFNELLARQVGGLEKNSPTYAACMGTVEKHVALLAEAGLDFKAFVGVDQVGSGSRGPT